MGTTRKTLSIFWRESWKYPKLFILTLVSEPLAGAQNLLLPLIASQALNKLIKLYNSHQTIHLWSTFWPYFALFVAAAVVGLSMAYVALTSISKLEVKVRQNLEQRVFWHLLSHSTHFHANSFSGSLVNQSTQFGVAYVSLADILVMSILDMLVRFGVAIVIIAYFSPLIALAMFIWTVIFMLLVLHLTKKRIHLSKQAAQAATVLTGHLADSMSNIGVIKAFAGEAAEAAAFKAKSEDRGSKKYAAWSRAIKNGSLIASMMATLQLVVLILLIYGVIHHHLEVGTLLLVQVYVTQFISVLWGFGTMTRNIEQALTDAAEMTEVLSQDIEVKDPPKPEKSRITRGAITYRDVKFAHGDNDKALFSDFTLQISAGEKIGLVGHSGSGKTTLTRLLLRFSDLDSGEITIDGQNIAHITQADLRRSIAYVPQEPLLFHRALRDNIAYGKPDATDAEIRTAATKAYATEFIDQLPEGYNTMVGERGIKLSGGQRQRIAIARAILKDAPILVLDEATSALDSESEQLIQAALGDLMKHRTAIVIAHRLSTIQKMDRIIVLEGGKIIEQGNHKELVARGGTYADLWKHQSGGFIEE